MNFGIRTRYFEAGEGGAGPAAPDPTPAPAPEPSEAAWAGPDQDEWNQVVSFLNQAAPILSRIGSAEAPAAPAAPTPDDPAFDPFDPNSVREFIERGISSGVDQALEPFKGVLGTVAQEKGVEMAKETLASFKAPGGIGEFDEEAALLVGASLIESMDPTEGLRAAAQWARDFEQRIRTNEREKLVAQYGEIAQAPDVPPVNGTVPSPVETPAAPRGRRAYHEVVERVLAENRPAFPTG